MERKIVIKDIHPDFAKFLAMPAGISKNVAFKDIKGKRSDVTNMLIKDDGTIHLSHSMFMIRKGNAGQYFTKYTNKRGFTVTPKGQLKVWFGHDVSVFLVGHGGQPFIEKVFQELKLDWFIREDVPMNPSANPFDETYKQKFTTNFAIFKHLLTATTLGKVLSGKVTNPVDLASAILKSNRIKCSSPKMLYNLLRSKGLAKDILLLAAKTAMNFDHFLEYTMKYPLTSTMRDTMDQAEMLEKKINFKWSGARIDKVHNQWTAEMMKYELENIEDKSLNYTESFKACCDFPGFKLLTTQREVFQEGYTMHHCIYTNYWHTIESGTFLAFAYESNGVRATLGLRKRDTEYIFDQMNLAYNARVPDYDVNEAKVMLAQLNQRLDADGHFVRKYAQVTAATAGVLHQQVLANAVTHPATEYQTPF